MASTAALAIVIKAKDDASKALGGIQGSLGKLGKVAAGLAVGAAAGVGALVVGIGKLASDAAALEPVRQSFERLATDAGTSAQAMLSSMREASQGMITDAALMENANKAMLLIGQDVADELPQMLKIAQAASRATGEDMGFMFQSLVTGIGRSSKLIIDNLGITMDVTAANEEYAAALGKTVDELTDAEKKQAFMNQVMVAGEDMINRLGEGTGGAQVTMAQLKTTFSNITTEVGSAFIPVLMAVLEPLGKLAQEYGPRVTEWATELSGKLQELATQYGPMLMGFLAQLGEFIGGTLIPAVSSIVSFIGDNFMPILAGLATAITIVVIPALVAWATAAAASAAATIAALAPIVIPIAAVVAAIVLLKKAWESNFGGIQDKTKAVFDFIQPKIAAVMDAIGEKINAVLDMIRGWWEENHALIQGTVETVWGWISGFIDTTLGIIQGVVETILTAVKDFWEDHGERIMSIVRSAWDIIETYIKTVINAILGIIKTVMLLIQGDWEGAWETIKDVGETIWEGIKSIVSSAIDIVENTLEIAMSLIQSAWNTAWDVLKTKVSDIVGDIKGTVGNFVQVGKDLIGGLIEGVKAMARGVLDAALGAVKDAVNAVKGWLGIGSPSTVFIEIGKALMAGLELGIGEGEAAVLERLGGVMRGLGSGFEAMISGLQALAGWEGIGEWTFFGLYVIPALENFKRDLRLVIQALSDVADEFGPEAMDAADRVAKVTSEIGRALSSITAGLVDLAGYTGIGEWTFVAGYVIPQIDALKRDLKAVVRMLAQTGIDVADAVPLAKAFAADVAEIMSNIATGVEGLNTLQEMGTAEPHSLIEAGKNLLASLADGFVQACSDEWERIRGAVGDLIEDLCDVIAATLAPILAEAGYSAGQSLMVGLIDGMMSYYDQLIQVVNDIIAAVQTALEAAAQIGSPSRMTERIGQQLAQGLGVGWEKAMGDWQPQLAIAMPAPGAAYSSAAAAPTPARGRGDVHIEVHNLYGTDREAAEKFGKYIAAQLRREGII